MDKDSPAHPHAAEDGNSSSDTQPIMTRDKMHDFVGLPTSKSKGLKRKFSCQSLSTQDSADVNGYAYEGLQDLIKESVTATSTSTNTSLTLKSRLLLPEPIPLLVRAQEVPSLEYDLHRLKIQRIGESHQHIYIPPMAKANLQAQDDDSFSLIDKVKEFLTSDREVMLILGDSGAGKSTFNRHLENQLWTNYGTGDPIPLHINLPAICNPENDMITKQLLMHGLTDEQIKEVKYHREFVVICDGYDESQLTVNLHKTNRLNRQGQWRAKMIISCRTQFLGSVYLDRFVPQGDDHYQHPAFGLFQEAVIAPFSKEQVEDYVTLYVSLKPRPWVMEDYMRMLTTIPNLMDLVKNPFLLTLSLEALPGVTKNQKDLTNIKISRAELYDHFVDQWFSVNIRRLQNSVLSKEDQVMLEQLTEAGFSALGVDYSTRLAEAIFDRHGGNPVIQYIHLKDQNTWKGEFFGMQLRVRLLRESSPLTRTGNLFRFIHRSMLEYFFSRYIYNPAMIEEGFDVQAETRTVVPHLLDVKGPLFQMDLLKEPSVIQFLCDRVKQSTIFEQILRSVIDQSKTNTSATTAATNAITILVRAASSSMDHTVRLWDVSTGTLVSSMTGHTDAVNDVSFSPDGLHIASAAYDKKVRLWDVSSVWSEAERQSRRIPILDVVYSVDGQEVLSCSTSSMRQWNSLTGVPGPVLLKLPEPDQCHYMAFSPDGRGVAAITIDGYLRLWDFQDDTEGVHLPERHEWSMIIIYSPRSRWLSTRSTDGIFWLWDLYDHQLKHALTPTTGESFEDYAYGAVFSPTGTYIAVGYKSGTIRIFDPHTGDLLISKKLVDFRVVSLAYSPSGLQLALGTHIGSIHLWDLPSEKPTINLERHINWIRSIAYSTCGQWIASGGDDQTVQVWHRRQDTTEESWSCAATVQGFFGIVQKVIWNPLVPLEFTTACWDGSLRVWRISGSNGRIAVNMLWGSNLQMLCVTDMTLKDATGLSPIQQKLLLQRGAINGVLEVEE
ncbi:hypothetical protein EC991_002932 [Linnemannia zychae]|nr:hypothetical protein EC991_002932 [Linnemannia zychae]